MNRFKSNSKLNTRIQTQNEGNHFILDENYNESKIIANYKLKTQQYLESGNRSFLLDRSSNHDINKKENICSEKPNRYSLNERKSFNEISNKISMKQDNNRTIELMQKSLSFIKGRDNKKKDQSQTKLPKQQVEFTQAQQIKDFIQQNSHLRQLLTEVNAKYNSNDEEIYCYVQELKKSLQNLSDFSGEQILKIDAKAPVPSQFQTKQLGTTHKKSKSQFQKYQ